MGVKVCMCLFKNKAVGVCIAVGYCVWSSKKLSARPGRLSPAPYFAVHPAKMPTVWSLTKNDGFSVSGHCTLQLAKRDKYNERRNTLPLLLKSLGQRRQAGTGNHRGEAAFVAPPWNQQVYGSEAIALRRVMETRSSPKVREAPCRQRSWAWELS